MALTLSKSKSKKSSKKIKKAASDTKKKSSALTSKKPKAKSHKEATIPNFLKKGKAAKALVKKEKLEADQRKLARDANRVLRFYIKPGDERTITFLDGALDADGDVEDVCYYEHSVQTQQGYPKFVCTAGYDEDGEDGSCPLCDSGNQSYFATVFTVLDHTTWVDRDGKSHEGTVMLFVAKPQTAEKLRKKAKKYGGLKGATFEVSRVGKKSAAVGDDFDYMETNTLKKVQLAFPALKIQPLDYEKVLPYVPASKLADMGVGVDSVSVGGEAAGDEKDLL